MATPFDFTDFDSRFSVFIAYTIVLGASYFIYKLSIPAITVKLSFRMAIKQRNVNTNVKQIFRK